MNKSGLVILNTKVRNTSHIPDGLEPGLPILDFEWSLGQQRLVDIADIILQYDGNKWLDLDVSGGNLVCKRISKGEGIILLADFDQRKDDIIYRHQRQIFLSSEGSDLRGQEVITFSKEALVAIRFVVNPSIQAQAATTDGKFITLSLDAQNMKKQKENTPKSWKLVYSECDSTVIVPPEQNSPLCLLFMKKITPQTPWNFKWAIRCE
jgi:hypothetical protein